MRNGDFAVEVVPRGKGIGVREIGSGHVLARPGQVYALRLRNFGPLRCVADVRIDGRERDRRRARDRARTAPKSSSGRSLLTKTAASRSWPRATNASSVRMAGVTTLRWG